MPTKRSFSTTTPPDRQGCCWLVEDMCRQSEQWHTSAPTCERAYLDEGVARAAGASRDSFLRRMVPVSCLGKSRDFMSAAL